MSDKGFVLPTAAAAAAAAGVNSNDDVYDVLCRVIVSVST